MYLLRDVDTEEAKNGVAFEAASAFLTIRIRRRQYIRMICILGVLRSFQCGMKSESLSH